MEAFNITNVVFGVILLIIGFWYNKIHHKSTTKEQFNTKIKFWIPCIIFFILSVTFITINSIIIHDPEEEKNDYKIINFVFPILMFVLLIIFPIFLIKSLNKSTKVNHLSSDKFLSYKTSFFDWPSPKTSEIYRITQKRRVSLHLSAFVVCLFLFIFNLVYFIQTDDKTTFSSPL
jgi:Mn2+/Fe2+ NRAMP family transporter